MDREGHWCFGTGLRGSCDLEWFHILSLEKVVGLGFLFLFLVLVLVFGFVFLFCFFFLTCLFCFGFFLANAYVAHGTQRSLMSWGCSYRPKLKGKNGHQKRWNEAGYMIKKYWVWENRTARETNFSPVFYWPKWSMTICHIEATLKAQGMTVFLVLTLPSPQKNKHWLAESYSVSGMGLDPEYPRLQLLLLGSIFLRPLCSIIRCFPMGINCFSAGHILHLPQGTYLFLQSILTHSIKPALKPTFFCSRQR